MVSSIHLEFYLITFFCLLIYFNRLSKAIPIIISKRHVSSHCFLLDFRRTKGKLITTTNRKSAKNHLQPMKPWSTGKRKWPSNRIGLEVGTSFCSRSITVRSKAKLQQITDFYPITRYALLPPAQRSLVRAGKIIIDSNLRWSQITTHRDSFTSLVYCAFSSEISVGWYTIKPTINLTRRFHVAMGLFNNRSPMTSKCGRNKKLAREAQLLVSLMFLPHFDVFCDLLLYRPTETWNQLRHGLMLLWFKDLMNLAEKLQFIHPLFRHSSLVLLSGVIQSL